MRRKGLRNRAVRLVLPPFLLLAGLSLPRGIDAATEPSIPPERTPIEGADFVRLLPPDGIPAIRDPEFVKADEARSFLRDSDPVLGVAGGGEAKAYGLWFLAEHEVVNDRLAGKPIAATW